MDDISQFLVKDSKKVILYLGMLLKGRCIITAIFGADNKEGFLTALLTIDEKKKRLVVDCTSKEFLNKLLFASPVIKFSTELNGITVKFDGLNIQREGSIEQPSFSIAIPASLYWIQRREFYRVKTLLYQKSTCTIIIPSLKTDKKLLIQLPIYDVSANGFSLLNDSEDYSRILRPFSLFKTCELLLDSNTTLPISIEIRSNFLINPKKSKSERVGCLITSSTPRTETILLKHIQSIEREIRKKERDIL